MFSLLSSFFNTLVGLVHTFLGGLDSLSHIFSPPPPQIPLYTRRKMVEYGIGYQELMQAYYSKRTEPGRKPGSTCGVYFDKTLAVGANYTRDDQNPKNYVIIGCWAKPIGDYYRKYGHVTNQYSKK